MLGRIESTYFLLLRLMLSMTLLFFGVSNMANADEVSCTVLGGIFMMNISVPGHLAVGSNVPNGTVVYSSGMQPVPPGHGFRCNNGTAGIGVYSAMGGEPSRKDISLFPISGTGLSFRWKIKQTSPSSGLFKDGYLPGEGYVQSAYENFDGFQGFELVKTGRIPAGAIVPGNQVEAGFHANGLDVEEVAISQSIVINGPTCKTHDVRIDMGSQKGTGFSGPNSRLTPVQSFIALDACPAEISAVSYQLDPTGAFDAATSVVSLSNDSTATGVGVQILDGNNKAMPLGKEIKFANYTPGGGSFQIPFNVAYFQTGKAVTGGTANAMLTFTLNYQ